MSDKGKEILVVSDEQPLIPPTTARSSDEQEIPQKCKDKKAIIYRVPSGLRGQNPKAYIPRTVALGPFHRFPDSNHNDPCIVVTEANKADYLTEFLERTHQTYDDIFCRIRYLERQIRDCYGEELTHYDSNLFTQMMVKDCCFILEYFLKIFERDVDKKPFEEKWKETDMLIDFVVFENQMPYFILEDTFQRAKVKKISFLDLSLFCFQGFNRRNLKAKDVQGPKHFTDLVRSFMVPPSVKQDLGSRIKFRGTMCTASELEDADLQFVGDENKFLVEMDYCHGKLTMAKFEVDDLTETLLRNVMALENRSYTDEAYVTDYFFLLNFLIQDDQDANILRPQIIVSWLSPPSELVDMVHGLGKDIDVDTINAKYNSICQKLKDRCEKKEKKERIQRKYFSRPVKILISIAIGLAALYGLYEIALNIILDIKGHRSKK